jgi:hypothetical protein
MKKLYLVWLRCPSSDALPASLRRASQRHLSQSAEVRWKRRAQTPEVAFRPTQWTPQPIKATRSTQRATAVFMSRSMRFVSLSSVPRSFRPVSCKPVSLASYRAHTESHKKYVSNLNYLHFHFALTLKCGQGWLQ